MKKLIYILAGLVAVFLIAAVAIPFLFKDKIIAKVKTEINNNINAKVEFSDLNISFFRHFPSLSLSLENLSIAGINEFEGDTLASVKAFDVGVNFWNIISGDQVTVKTIILDRPNINIIVLENGKANYDIAKADSGAAPSGESSAFKMKLKHYEINEGTLSYDDRLLVFKMILENFNHSGSGDFTQDLFILSTTTQVFSTNLSYGGVKYISDAKTGIKADLDMDMKNFKFTFKQNEIKLNELGFGIDGWMAMPGEDISMDLKFDAKKNEFKNFISMIPGVYREGFKDVKSSGQLSLDGFVKGTYNETQIPGFGITINVQNGMFQYPSLPTGVNNVNIDLKVNNPDGKPDNTIINLSKLHAEFGNEPFDARLVVKTPVSDADIDAMMKGKIDLANISKIVPLEEGTSMKGVLFADMKAKGRMSAIEEKRYEDFEAAGTMKLSAFNYVSKDFKDGISINNCELSFNPKNILLNNFDMKSGGTDIQANGTLDNLPGYYFKDDLLKGTLHITSNQIDLNPYMSDASTAVSKTETASKDTAQLSVIEIPSNIDFVMTAKAGKVLYENLILRDASGNVSIRQSSMGMNDLTFNLLDGKVIMNGLYATKNPKNPDINFDLQIQQMDIKKTFENFVTVQKLAPIAGKCSGKFSTSFAIKGMLDRTMQPVYESLGGGGKLQTHGASIDNFTPLVKVAEVLKMEQFKKATISDANLSFKIIEGRVYIEPYEQVIAGIKSRIEGSTGLDQSISYTMGLQLPTKQLPGAATNVISGLISKANSAGANLSMGETVNVNVKIGGTVNNPVVETGIKDVAKGIVDSAKDKINAEIDKKKQEALAKADSLKRVAEDKAKAEADRLKKEAEARAKAEADRLKKEAEEKAKKEVGSKLKDLFGKPK